MGKLPCCKAPFYLIGLIFITSGVMLGACSSDEVSMTDKATQSRITKANAKFFAGKWIADNDPQAKFRVLGDSYVGKDGCYQGDGWSTVVVNPPEKMPYELQCATYDNGEDCWTNAEFNARAHLKSTKNKCAKELPKFAEPVEN